MRSAAVLMILSAMLGADIAAADSQAIPQPNVIFTRQRVFRIPFDVEPAKQKEQTPQEVELHVSQSMGQRWAFYTAVPPKAKGFTYRTHHDGEYWFVVRTINQKGERLPSSIGPDGRPVPTVPELAVVVDTVRPFLNLQVFPGQAGELLVRWQTHDPHLSSDRPQISYRELHTPNSQWQPVAVNAGLTGQATIPAPRGPVAVRAMISDKAENVSTQILQVVNRGGRIETVANPHPVENQSNDKQGKPWASTAGSASTAEVNVTPKTTDQSQSSQDVAAKKEPSVRPEVSQTAQKPVAEPEQTETVASKETVGNKDDSPMGAVAEHTSQTHQPNVQPILVNSVRFLLDYEVQSVGNSGIKSIALWGTKDGGRTWSQYGVDTDMQSPIEVNVPQDGVYGFLMAVASGSGVGGQPPFPGTKPEIWVNVDVTAPEVKVTSVQQDQERPDQVHIAWEARDPHLTDRSVSLFFSGSPNGPWYPIAEGVANTGKFVWRNGNTIPGGLHVRVVVQDAAGNRSFAQGGNQVAPQVHANGPVQTARPWNSRFPQRR